MRAFAVRQQSPIFRGPGRRSSAARPPRNAKNYQDALASLPGALGNRTFAHLIQQGGIELPGRGDAREQEAARAEAGSGRPTAVADPAGVQVHTDAQAERMAAALDSRAFTVGTDIFFGAGEYNPNSAEGRRLLDHEMAHATMHADESRPAILQEPLSLTQRGEQKRGLTLTPDVPPPRVFQSESGATMATVYFGQDDFLLGDPASLKVLNDLAVQVGFLTGATVEVDGHASGEGTAAHNLELSEKRRQAVIAILSSSLQSPVDFGGKAHGEAQPSEKESGSGKELARQQSRNRRVEIFIAPRPALEEEKKEEKKKPFDLFPKKVDPRPETLDEKLDRMMRQKTPEPPKKRSVSEMVLKKVDEGVDRVLSRTNLSPKWRERIRKAARSAVTGAAGKALDTVLDQSSLGDNEKKAIKSVVKGAAKTPAL